MEDETKEKKIPKYIEELNNGNIKITTKDGVFEIEDSPFEELEKMRKRCKGEETKGLISLSIVSIDGVVKKVDEKDVGKLKSSTVAKIMQGTEVLYGVENIEELF